MDKFQLTDKINANKALSFADKAILNQIISFTRNGGICHATNSYFAECWGVDEQKIKRTMKILNDHGLITSKVERKKHTEGDKTWYNKRYLTVNRNVLAEFLKVSTTPTQDAITTSKAEALPVAKPVITLQIEQVEKTADTTTVNSFKLFKSLNYFSISDLFAVNKHYRKTDITLIEAIQGIEELKQYNSKYPKMPPMPNFPNDIIERITEKFKELVYETAC